MFLRHRSRQAEYFDEKEQPEAEVERSYRELDRLNRCFRHADPFRRRLGRGGDGGGWREVRILEVGAGTGGLACELKGWAEDRGWRWEFTCLDANPVAARLNPLSGSVCGNATALPFDSGSFDWVIASQMTHHLDDREVVRHFQEAWRVARRGIVISDLHRNLFLLALVTVTGPLLGLSHRMREDGRLSVRRGFRIREWQWAAEEAEIPRSEVEVEVQFGCRIVLVAERRGSEPVVV